jgi:C-terminal processing protease CtpA/Prc
MAAQIVDERSASATELFAAMLQDSKAALMIGAPNASPPDFPRR